MMKGDNFRKENEFEKKVPKVDPSAMSDKGHKLPVKQSKPDKKLLKAAKYI